jgi:integrase
LLKLAAYLPKPVHPSTWRVDSPTFASGKISRPPLPLQKALKAVLSAGTAGPERKVRASSYADPDLLFATRKGAPLDAQNIVNLHFKPLLKHADLPSIRWHDLRHTCATLLLGSGVHPKFVQHLLGHASITMTLDRYSHLMPSMGRHAADDMDEALGYSLLLTYC